MTCINASIFKRHVENPQGALLGNLILAWFRQIVVIFAPLYLCSVVLLNGAFNLHLRSVENCGGSANFQTDFLHARVVLNVFWVADRYGGPVVFGRALLRVADFLVRRLETGTHGIQATYFVVLSHCLFAQNRSVFIAGTARLWAARPLANLPARGAIEHIAILTVGRGWVRAHAVRNNHCVFATPRHFVNAINFPGFNPNTAWFSARRIVWIVPSGRAWDIVARSYSVLWLRLRRTQVWRNNFSGIVANAVNYKLFNAAQTRGAAARVAFVAPWVGFSRNGSLNFNLIVIESVSVGWSVWIIVAAICERARLHKASLVVVCRLVTVTLAVVDGCDDFRELQKDFTFVLSDSDAFAACHATWTPITCDESVEIQFSR